MRAKMIRADGSNIFTLTSEYNTSGVRITDVFIEDNDLPRNAYIFLGPRTVNIEVSVPRTANVFAEIQQL